MPPADRSTPKIVGPDEEPPPLPVGGIFTTSKTSVTRVGVGATSVGAAVAVGTGVRVLVGVAVWWCSSVAVGG